MPLASGMCPGVSPFEGSPSVSVVNSCEVNKPVSRSKIPQTGAPLDAPIPATEIELSGGNIEQNPGY